MAFYNTFVVEYPNEASARAGVLEMFKAFPFLPDDRSKPHTVAISIGDRVQAADDMEEALRFVTTDPVYHLLGSVTHDEVAKAIATPKPEGDAE